MTGQTPDWQTLAAADAAIGRSDWASAISGYRAALARAPDNPNAWFNLGYALRATRQWDAALRAYSAALDHGLDQPEAALVNIAAIHSEHLAQPRAAEDALRSALKANARFVPALLNLGMLLEDNGDSDGAGRCYQEVLAQDPGNGRAHLRQTMIALHKGDWAQRLPPLKAAAETTGLTYDDRADIGFALANALDAGGLHQEAWAAMMQANSDDLATLSPAQRYDRQAHAKLVDELIQTSPSVDVLEPANGAPQIVFICGLFRSGSTLVEQILARHPAVAAAGELDFIPALVAGQIDNYPQALAHTPIAQRAIWRDVYLNGLKRIVGNAPLVTDKRCDNFLHIGLIKALFPTARIVHTVRNPADVMISTLFLRFGGAVNYGASPDDFVDWHSQYARLMRHWKDRFGDDIIDVDYDRLVAGPRATIARLLEQLGLEWEEACLGHHEDAGMRVTTASGWQVRQPVHQRSSGRARAYADMIAGWHEQLERATLTDPR